jgi:hypothetical protein
MDEDLAARTENIDRVSELEKKLDSEPEDNLPAHNRPGDWYFAPKPFERWQDGKIYKWLGVKYVEMAVRDTAVKLKRKTKADCNASHYFIGSRLDLKSIKRYEEGTRSNEVIHIFGVFANAYLTMYFLNHGLYAPAAIYAAMIAYNSALLMLQRYNRVRVYNILDRVEARRRTSAQSSQSSESLF